MVIFPCSLHLRKKEKPTPAHSSQLTVLCTIPHGKPLLLYIMHIVSHFYQGAVYQYYDVFRPSGSWNDSATSVYQLCVDSIQKHS